MQLLPPSYFDDEANGYTAISTVPLSAALGAEILGVDLANLSDEQFLQIESALYRYKVIYFRKQDISLTDQENFTLRFGSFGTDAYTDGMTDHPNIQHLVKEAATVVHRVFGDGWHTDSPFLAKPPGISVLYGKDIPPYGGDTWWANGELAYEQLSDTMKAMIAPLKVHMSAGNVMKNIHKDSNKGQLNVGEVALSMDQQKMITGSYHPIVRTHPITGKKSLYVEQAYSMGIEGMTEAESAPLLKFLSNHIIQEDFTCRLRWEENTVVVWDNRSSLHKAFNDYDGYRREMFRTIVDGEAPF